MPELEVLVRRAARPNGLPPLLFVHGAHMGAWCWDEHFMAHFAAAGFDCRAVSLRGHGRSRGRESLDLYGVADYVEDVAHAGIDLARAPVVVGHSMGAVVALHYARTHGAAALVLIGSVPPEGLLAASLALCWRAPGLYAQFVLVQSGQGHLADFRRLSSALFAEDMPFDVAFGHFSRMGRESSRVFAELSWPHVCDVRAPADVPVAVLGGCQDGLFPETAARAVARRHGVEARLCPGLGHTLMLDPQWRTAADWIAGWIEETCSRRRQGRPAVGRQCD